MKKNFLALLFACCALPCFATTIASGSKVQDNNGNLLSSGQWCYNGGCLTVTNGAFFGAVAPGTSTVTVVNGSTVYITIKNVTIQGGQFSWDAYAVSPLNGMITGLSQPRIPCSAGAQYTQTDSPFTLWQANSNAGTCVWGATTPSGPPSSVDSGGTGGNSSGSALANLLGNPTPGTYSINCASANSCSPLAGGGGSGVSSIAWTVPSFMTANPTSLTSAGTQTFSFNSQIANLFFASPNGSSGPPSFRALVAADIPTLTPSQAGLGSVSNAAQTLNSIVPNSFSGLRFGNSGTVDTAASSAQLQTVIGAGVYDASGAAAARAAVSLCGANLYATGTGTATTPCTQVAYSQLSGAPTLAATIAAATHQFLTSYTSGTGVFTLAQPAFTDISGNLGTGQGPTSLSGPLSDAAGTLTVATQHQLGAVGLCSDSTGSGIAQTCTTSPSFTPVAGDCVTYVTTTANTGAGLTLNVNALGAKSVAKWLGTTTLAAGDVALSSPVQACYTGTVWNLTTIGNAPSGSGGTGTVTSFSSGNLSPLFTVAVASASSTPAQTFSLSTAAQNAFFAGPATGGTGAPSYRAIVAADVPTLNQATTGNAGTASAVATTPTTTNAAYYFLVAPLNTGNQAPNTIAGATINPSTLAVSFPGAIGSTGPSGDAGMLFLPGNTLNQTCPTNNFCWFGFASASATAYALQPSSTAPTTGQIPVIGTVASGVAPFNYESQVTIPQGGTGAATAAAGLAALLGAPSAGTYTVVCTSSTSCAPGAALVADTTITVAGSVAFSANVCSSVAGVSGTASTVSMTNLATTMTATFTPNSDVHAVTGWSPASGGQLYFTSWPSAAGTLSYYVCNGTGSTITTGGSVTWNVSAR